MVGEAREVGQVMGEFLVTLAESSDQTLGCSSGVCVTEHGFVRIGELFDSGEGGVGTSDLFEHVTCWAGDDRRFGQSQM